MAEPISSRQGADRLLRHLQQPGGFARFSVTQDGQLDLFQRRNGVTLGAGSVPAEAGEALIATGSAEWCENQLQAAVRKAPADMPMRDLTKVPDAETPSQRVTVNRAESPLAWLAARAGRDGQPLIPPRCLAAGERLRLDLERAAMLPRLGVDWTRTPGEGGGGPLRFEPGESALAARQRSEAALSAVGSDLSGLLIDVCGFLKGLSVVEFERGWPPRSARIMLALALGRLADHYGLSEAAQGPERPVRRNHVWRGPGARPDQMPGSGGEGGSGVGADALDHGAHPV